MGYYIPRQKIREVKNPKFRNYVWENWTSEGYIPGILLIFLGIALSIIEIVRIVNGVTNRGIHNYDSTGNSDFTIFHESLLWKVDIDNFPIRVEKFHFWPWSYPANLFGLVAIFAGVSGVVSYYRRSYSTIFLFMSLSLLSGLFGFYLITYYSILVNCYSNKNWDLEINRSQTMNTSWGLIGTNLALSCCLVLVGFSGFILGFLGIRGGERKGLHLEERYIPFAENPGSKGQIVANTYAF